jgi:hypothetical protein
VGEQLLTSEAVELIVQIVRCPTTTAYIWLMVCVRAWIAERRATRKIRGCSTQSLPAFGSIDEAPARTARGGFSVDGV